MGRRGTSVNKAKNFALIVHRLMTQPRGWAVDALIKELGIKERTYRDYRQELQQDFEPFFDHEGGSRLQEVELGEGRRVLKLVDLDEYGPSSEAARERFMGMHLVRKMFSILDGTALLEAVDDILQEVEAGLKDRGLRYSWKSDLERKLYVHPEAPRDYSNKGEVLSSLLHALMHERRITIVYDSASWEKPAMELELEPLSLVLAKGSLYLMARMAEHGDVRSYALERIDQVKGRGERFVYPELTQYDPAKLFDGYFGAFAGSSGSSVEVKLRFANIYRLKKYLMERTWHQSQEFIELEDGRLLMTFKVQSMNQVWPWIRSFGKEVQVLAPSEEAHD